MKRNGKTRIRGKNKFWGTKKVTTPHRRKPQEPEALNSRDTAQLDILDINKPTKRLLNTLQQAGKKTKNASSESNTKDEGHMGGNFGLYNHGSFSEGK